MSEKLKFTGIGIEDLKCPLEPWRVGIVHFYEVFTFTSPNRYDQDIQEEG